MQCLVCLIKYKKVSERVQKKGKKNVREERERNVREDIKKEREVKGFFKDVRVSY